MRQVVQDIKNGKLGLRDVPKPLVRPGAVVTANACSLISSGTEKMAMDLAQKSLARKASKQSSLRVLNQGVQERRW